MNDSDKERIALFRYSLIAPILNDQVASKKDYLAQVCAKAYDVPYYGRKEFAPKTIEQWLREYRRGNLHALKPSSRSDKGSSRAIKTDALEKIMAFRKEKPEISAALFYEQLIVKGICLPSDFSYTTIYRFLKKNNLLGKQILPSPERKRFSYDKVNILWQGDMAVGPYLIASGKKLRTYLFAFIDDCSRLVPYARFFFSEKFDSLKMVFKESLLRRGIPKMVYVDNGMVYHCDQIGLACACLGISLIHTKPYDPEAKGKIERFFGTVRSRFFPLLTDNELSSLDSLNNAFAAWLEQDYNRKIHSANEMAPLDLFMSQASSIRLISDPAYLEKIFLKREFRKVKHDSTITLNNLLFEVPPRLIAQKVEVRYDPTNQETIYLYENDMEIFKANPVSFTANASVKRSRDVEKAQPISFQDILSPGVNK